MFRLVFISPIEQKRGLIILQKKYHLKRPVLFLFSGVVVKSFYLPFAHETRKTRNFCPFISLFFLGHNISGYAGWSSNLPPVFIFCIKNALRVSNSGYLPYVQLARSENNRAYDLAECTCRCIIFLFWCRYGRLG